MNDPERLIQGEDELVQALMRAGESDGPSDASRQKVAAALGVGAFAQAASKSAALASQGSLTATQSSLSGGLLKWTGGTLVVLGLVGGAALLLRQEDAPVKPPSVATDQTRALPPAPPPAPTPAERLESTPPTPVADAPVMTAQPKVVRRPPKAVTTRPKVTKVASTLDAEMALLDGARASLRAGRPGDALRALDGYDAQFPHGLLVPEATVVRIEALVNSGDKAGALRLGERFLRAHPDSPLAARVRSLTNP